MSRSQSLASVSRVRRTRPSHDRLDSLFERLPEIVFASSIEHTIFLYSLSIVSKNDPRQPIVFGTLWIDRGHHQLCVFRRPIRTSRAVVVSRDFLCTIKDQAVRILTLQFVRLQSSARRKASDQRTICTRASPVSRKMISATKGQLNCDRVHDLRAHPDLTIETAGFQIVDAPTSLQESDLAENFSSNVDIFDPTQIDNPALKQYHAEIEQ